MKPTRFTTLCLLFLSIHLFSQTKINGKVTDNGTGETLIGAAVVLEGTTVGTTTDLDGKFQFLVDKTPPFNLVVSFIGYESQTIIYSAIGQKIDVKLAAKASMLDAVEVTDFRISEKQRQEPLTVERMDILAIKETPADNFYDGLAMMKGVDLTSASLGFKVINTRGFNSTSPVRSLQLIDGVDNQSPGLNFSLGNFLGSSDLDVLRVDIIAGASSAFYGPGAFNGVINMTTKNPFDFQGLSASVKYGERNMQEYAFRWAQVLKNKDGVAKFGYKVNAYYMQALDWFAENYDPVDGSKAGMNNPGGNDVVNIYGDEIFEDKTDILSKMQYPGYGIVHKQGYREVDLADYHTNNLKANIGGYYRLTDSVELSYNVNYSTGTTVYQGDNRYSLKDIQFLQNKLEIGKKGKWFVRAYATHEDAGKSYDIVTTGVRMMESTISADINGNDNWFTRYRTLWGGRDYARKLKQFDDYPDPTNYNSDEEWGYALDQFLLQYEDTLVAWHQKLRSDLNQDSRAGLPAYEPGTAAFDSAFNDITTRKFTDGGSLFFDRSALYHTQAEYQFELGSFKCVVGANARLYTPNSQGTIFQDTLTYHRQWIDSAWVITDSSYRKITNREAGAYAGLGRAFLDKKLQTNLTLRVDKNQNFNFLCSPALSAVYSPDKNHTFRATFSSAIRNPTLADQYLYYNVGRAILLGNLNGYDSLVTVNSLLDYLAYFNKDTLEYFSVDPIKPERVKTIEGGYRGIFKEKVYVDISAYTSWYSSFIGYRIGVDVGFDVIGFPQTPQVYRLATNATSVVRTQGLNIGANYYYAKKHAFNANYSYNQLITGEEDPIIPAFNTPKNKFNIGVSGRDIIASFLKMGRWGYSVNYRWVQGFVFEGSPQFSGKIDSYGLLNAQINYHVPKWNATLKLGASNALNNKVYQVYGGPQIGRIAYLSFTYDWNKI